MKKKLPQNTMEVLDGIADIAEGRDPEAEAYNQMQEAREDRLAEMASLQGFERPIPLTDVGKEIELVNFLRPFKYDKEGSLKEGEVPLRMLEEYFGFLHPKNSLTYKERRDHEVSKISLRIAEKSRRMAIPRKEYTPQLNANTDNIEQLYDSISLGSMYGFEREKTKEAGIKESKQVSVGLPKKGIRNVFERVKHEYD